MASAAIMATVPVIEAPPPARTIDAIRTKTGAPHTRMPTPRRQWLVRYTTSACRGDRGVQASAKLCRERGVGFGYAWPRHEAVGEVGAGAAGRDTERGGEAEAATACPGGERGRDTLAGGRRRC